MEVITSCFAVGILFSLAGFALVLTRFFGTRRGTVLRIGSWSPPPYVGGWLLALCGAGLLGFGFAEFAAGSRTWPVLFVAGGVTVAGLVAVPALMLTVTDWPRARDRFLDGGNAILPWRFAVGFSAFLFSIGSGVIITVALLIVNN